jgi:N6-L-threonylcarbamoyladenine synthase
VTPSPPLSPPFTVLGVETSCDETAAAVVRLTPGRPVDVLSSVVLSQTADHAPYGGVVPEIAARAHVETIDAIVGRALWEAGVAPAGLDAIAATAGPGLVGGVMVGLAFGKAMALALGCPLIAVNHLEGHAVSARLTADIPYPFLLLLVSGGHCQLLEVAGIGACRRLGSTIDDAAGEAFDKIGGALGLPYPAGPALERLAEGGDPSRFPLPRALRGRDGCDFSFSGLKTAAARRAATLASDTERRDLAAAVQAAIARQLADRTERAMTVYDASHEGRDRRLVVAGGVAANGAVRRALESLADRRGFAFAAPPLAYCTDNAAMIALAGAERLALGLTDGLDVVARPRWPLDEAAARLRPTHAPGRKGAKA